MSDEKGFLTNEQEKALAVLVDEAIKFKGLMELIDGYLAKFAFSTIDDVLLERVVVKEEVSALISDLADAVIVEDLAAAETTIAKLLDAIVDIPGVDDIAEALIFESAVKLLAGAVVNWIQKKKDAEETEDVVEETEE